MAAIPSSVPHAARPSHRGAAESGSPSAAARVVATALAAASAAIGFAIARAYPIASPAAVAVFVAWAAFAFFRCSLALPAMLALLPIVGFATFTGWLTFEELDLLVLASGAGGYAALALRRSAPVDETERRHRPKLSIFAIALAALFVASTAVALVRGIDAAGGFRFDWFQGYDDPLNGLRIFKSFAWALLMTPLLVVELRKPGGFDRFAAGLAASLAIGTLLVLQERLSFTGPLDFSDDYRVTGGFWEMHVGGAALDGFVALMIPFAVREVVRNVSRTRLVAAWATLALAAYACLVTFSRGVYAAVPLSMLLLVVLVHRQHPRFERRVLWSFLAKGAAFALLVAVSGSVVFHSGGYRAVIAAFLVLTAAIPVEASMRRTGPGHWAVAAVTALVAATVGHLLGAVLPKGPYLVFTLSVAVVAAALLQTARGATKTLDTMTIAAWLWLAIGAALVAGHWGGRPALAGTAAVLAVSIACAFALSRRKRSIWPEERSGQLAVVGFAALVMGSVAVFSAGAYMGGRFSSSRGDLGARIAHWTESIGRLHGAGDWLLGKGLGRFPATSQFESPDAVTPGSYRVSHRDGETFLALTGPRIRYLGFGELFRFLQRVSVRPQANYTVTIEARSAEAGQLHVELCERQLLYPAVCFLTSRGVEAGADRWQRLVIPVATGTIGGSPWYRHRPVYFGIANGNAGGVIEIRRLQMIGPDGVDVIANGDFGGRTAHWFSSSDKWHLPWHIKNIVLDVLFDQGVVGLVLFALLVGGALLRTTVGRAFRHPDAPYVAAAITGYLVVGAFDSLLDVPRVAFAFYLVMLTGLMLRNPRAITTPAASPAAPPAQVVDEAAARALRRQRAFGERAPAARRA